MSAQFMAIAVVVATFSSASYANSCAAGFFSSLIGTPCTIGDTTFTFSSGDPSCGGGCVAPSILTFTPLVTSTSVGFEITGFPAANKGQEVSFIDLFTAVPSSGTITSFRATLNGVSVPADGSSIANLQDTTGQYSYNSYVNGIQTQNSIGGPLPNGFGTGPSGGLFDLDNASNSTLASFTSADFVFNESPASSMPEGSELAIAGITTLGILGAMRKKFLIAR